MAEGKSRCFRASYRRPLPIMNARRAPRSWPLTLRRHPFEMRGSYLALAHTARRVLPPTLVNRLLPGEPGTIGREPALTDWDAEYGA